MGRVSQLSMVQTPRHMRRRVRRSLGRLGTELKAFDMRFPGRTAMARYGMPRSRINWRREVGDGLGSSVVMAPILFVAKTFPEAPLRISVVDADGTEAPVYDHPMLELLDRPNDAYPGELLWMASQIDYLSSGNAFWLKVRGPLNRVVQLWYTPSWMMRAMWPEDGSAFISHYEYRPDASKPPVRVDVQDVVHFRFGLDPRNPRMGFSPLASVLREVYTDDEAASFTATLLKNAGVPGVIIMPEADTEIEDAEAIKADYRDKFGGDHRGEPMVMTAGIKLTKLTFSPVELDLKSLRRIPEERITAVLGVPAIVAGLGAGLDRSTFSNMAEAREMAYESNIIPSQRLFAAELKVQLLEDFDVSDRSRRVWFDTSAVRVLQEDEDRKEARLNTRLQSGAVMVSEYRSALGLPTTPAHDVYLRGANILEIPAGAGAAPPKHSRRGYMFVEVVARGKTQAAPLALSSGRKEPDDTTRRLGAALARRLEREREGHAEALAKSVERKISRLAADIGATVRERSKSSGQPYSATKAEDELPPVEWPQWLLDMYAGSLSIATLLPADLGDAYLAAEFQASYAAVGEATYAAVSDTLGVVVGWDLNDPLNQALLETGATQAGLVDVDGQTQAAIYKALQEGRAAGDSIPQLVKRIQDYVEGCALYPNICESQGPEAAAKYRATVIARTESKTAQNLSSLYAMLKSDIVEGVLVFDGDGCGWTGHADADLADGSTRTLEDALAHPLAHPQCVRSFAPVVRSA
jgi:HK97 family phage portal protein